MDEFIWTKLEKLWLKVPLSPFEISKFLYVGAMFSCVALVYKGQIFGGVGWILCSWSGYYSVMYRERENNKGFINSDKSRSFYRYALFTFCLIQGFIYPLQPDIALYWLAVFFLSWLAAYFKTINWTRPPAKTVYNKAATLNGV